MLSTYISDSHGKMSNVVTILFKYTPNFNPWWARGCDASFGN